MMLGRPGSGKTSLLAQLINSPEFYGNKFGRILYITPS
jgi:Ni2+-binding GTPase involved in maturation of urease and hydrogenase